MNNKISGAIRYNESVNYPASAPFDPDKSYPETVNIPISEEQNDIYTMVRDCFSDLKMDKENIGTEKWSPLSELVFPGDTVVIKPNLVLNTSDPNIQECTTTHPSILRPVIDYCWKALNEQGEIIVGDAPSAEANFDEIVDRTGIRKMIEILQHRGVNVHLKDFRALRVTTDSGIWTGEQVTNTDKPNSKIVNLKNLSMFSVPDYAKKRLHGAGYDIKATNRHHHGNRQEYCISESILNADVVISVPKLKTHRKAGITCCLKNLVGINTDKNYLPHFSLGGANMNGDEMPSVERKYKMRMRLYNWIRENIIAYTWHIVGGMGVRFLKKMRSSESIDITSGQNNNNSTRGDEDIAKWLHNRLSGQKIAAGAWPGNETICRMILDLNRIFLYCDENGNVNNKKCRRILYIIDGILSGAGNGPTSPIPLQTGSIAVGSNGLELDLAMLKFMGVDSNKIPLYRMAKEQKWMFDDNPRDILINGDHFSDKETAKVNFRAPDSWDY
ncbi:DUF362 domain-containing protein [Marispirochaeta aestuarii]|uniref:DUF362 domain-containing protein n=1 Tax=Marispirochaeta aestuarii TaxID=1963862 RepID=UPI0029C6AAA5|nr:DUF362 domain-containing protein [Marispirochaeta aestuarii]